MAKNANIKDAIQAVKNELSAVDREIGQLHEQRRQVESAPMTREAAKQAAQNRINTAARDGYNDIAKAASAIGHGRDWNPAEVLDTWLNARDSFKLNNSLIVALMSDHYIAAIEKAIDADPAFDHGLTDEQRKQQLADLDVKIADAEARRETLEHELSEAGLLPGAGDDAEESAGGDKGMQVLIEQHERQRQQKNAELAAAGATKRERPKVINAFDKDNRITVGG